VPFLSLSFLAILHGATGTNLEISISIVEPSPMNQPTDVLCAGIIVADHVSAPISHLPAAGELVLADQLLLAIGGCAANVAVDLTKMGVAAGVVGRVGSDIFGRVVADLLRAEQVDVSALQVTTGLDTSQTLIVNVKNEDRRFIHSFGANAAFQPEDIPADRVEKCKVLYLGGYLLMPEVRPQRLAQVFAAARRRGVKTVLDVVTPGPAHYLPWLEPLLPEVDVFLPNNHEAELITGENDPLRQAEVFGRLGAGTVVVTLGDKGAVLIDRKQKLRAGAFRVPFVDGTGGGDAFAAGYICGLLKVLRGTVPFFATAPNQRGAASSTRATMRSTWPSDQGLSSMPSGARGRPISIRCFLRMAARRKVHEPPASTCSMASWKASIKRRLASNWPATKACRAAAQAGPQRL
jgi:sugar/nucleoside kinase (ribokinase family)